MRTVDTDVLRELDKTLLKTLMKIRTHVESGSLDKAAALVKVSEDLLALRRAHFAAIGDPQPNSYSGASPR